MDTLAEPWFEIKPVLVDEGQFTRPELPVGPTSFTGRPFTPEARWKGNLKVLPESTVKYFHFKIQDLNKVLYEGYFSTEDIFRVGAEYVLKYLFRKESTTMEASPF